MKRFSFFFALLMAGLLTSCTDVVDVDLPEPEPQLAVEGNITDQPGPYTIRLTRTGAYFTKDELPAVRGAQLTLADNEGTTETLRETAPGVYQTSQIRGKIGNHYTLTIQDGDQQYRALTEIKRTPGIDRLEQQIKTNEPGWDDGYYALYNGPELPGVGDYYRFKIWLNGELQNDPDDLVVRDDALVDGNYIGDIELNGKPLQVGDSVRVQLLSLPRDYYYFLNEMYTQINNVGLFSSPPANVRTNVLNLSATGPKAVGYFAGTAVRSARLTIQP
ncbi:DUF4249 domain-containing protein [Hymenobacter busanensis]|uniref:DUF4249 domain-containing protein n=1 Tax=Hymenobacter busanensis TaxID=2607656 RepID=A0A7L5A2S0_9BACT|nr:DUF4249 domain-containing protein [Hymenobacter busanensis]KAA9331590.1 DUF4249 domain-containing protein [Hymenobacter busanensis]QHJ08742.1 DUF4249 family protein [Hymenobacter busanensis]